MSGALSLAGEGILLGRRGGFRLDVPKVEAQAGRTLCLLGPSGSGKTTLLQVLGLLSKPDAGRVLLGGEHVTPADRAACRKMAAVFQRPYLFRGTVGENVSYGLRVRHMARGLRAEKVAEALTRVGLAGYERRASHLLSGGEAQRVSLARALVVEPRVLLLDEPLASLDPLLRRHLTVEFARILRDSGTTAVWVTHDQDEALTAADHIAIMRSGSVVASGSAENVASLPLDEWTATFLGVPVAQTGVVVGIDDGLVEIDVVGTSVFVTGDAAKGDRVALAVRPEDVILFESGSVIPTTTARNRLDARVVGVERRGATDLATLESGGLRFAASVSRAAARELSIAPDTRVLAVFKATAVRWSVQTDQASGQGLISS